MKVPDKSTEPPTVFKERKPLRFWNWVLLANWKVPPMDTRLLAVTLVNLVLPLKANDWPTFSNSGKETDTKLFWIKAIELLTAASLGKKTSPASRIVMLVAQTSWGKEQLSESPLNSTERASLTFAKATSTEVKWLLLLMLKVFTVTKLIPLRLLRSVSAMRTLDASVTPLVKVNWLRAGRVVHEIEPTLVNSGMDKVSKTVKPCRTKLPSICLSIGQVIEVNPAAPLMMRSPSIVWTLGKEMVVTPDPTVTSPLMVLQLFKALASPSLLISTLLSH